MINFRFHLISIIAVFLALTIGIVMGATVIDQSIVDRLNERITAVSNRAEERRQANDALTGEVGRLTDFVGEAEPFVIEDRLAAVPIVVLAVRGVDPAVVVAQVEALREAGAVTPGIVWIEESWSLEGDAAEQMAAILGEEPGRRPALRAAAWTALATRLDAGGAAADGVLDVGAIPSIAPAPDSFPDLLVALSEAGFLQIEAVGDESTELTNYPGSEARVVLLTGTGARRKTGTRNLIRIGTESLEAAGVPTVVGEIYGGDDATRGAVLERIRSDGGVDLVSTVDDVEVAEGRMAVVLAASDLGRDPPIAGHYGYGDGAQSALPPYRAGP